LADEILSDGDVPFGEGFFGLGHERSGEAAHALDRLDDVFVLGRLVA
jgi:hypothetical protein